MLTDANHVVNSLDEITPQLIQARAV